MKRNKELNTICYLLSFVIEEIVNFIDNISNKGMSALLNILVVNWNIVPNVNWFAQSVECYFYKVVFFANIVPEI